MTTITGTTKSFKQMFEMIMCGSKYPLFPNVILEIGENIISVNAMDPSRAVGTNQQYTDFIIEGSNNIPIDTVSIYEAIKLFDNDEQLKITYDDKKLTLTSDSNGKKDSIVIPVFDNIELTNSPMILNEDSIIINDNKMEFGAHVTVNTSYIKDQIRKGSFVNKSYHDYLININGNKLTLSVGDTTNYEISSSTEIEVENGFGQAGSMYSHGYDDIFGSLSGDVVIHINEEKPMLIVQTTDNYSVKFLVAPVIK